MRENRRGAAGAIIAVVLILLPILLMSGSLDKFGGTGGRVWIESKVDTRYIRDIPGTIGSFVTELTQNPFAEQGEVKAEASTKTSAATGLKVINDPKDGTGILSPNPRSEQDYTLSLGVKNPTKDFIAKESKLFLGNAGNITNRTGLKFNDFKWDDGTAAGGAAVAITPRGCEGSYFSGSASSVNAPPDNKGQTAVKVSSTKDVGPTNINLEVDYSYKFKSTFYLTSMDIDQGGMSVLTMYQAKFIVYTQKNAQNYDKIKDSYKLKEYAAGGPVVVSRKDTQYFLEKGKTINLIFTIKNANPNSGVFEAVDFKGNDKIKLVVPPDLTPANTNVVCTDKTYQGEKYKVCTVNNMFTTSNANIKLVRESACGPDGCLFNNYDTAKQGFSETESHILTDESPNDEWTFSAPFTVAAGIDKDKVYNVYLMFIEDAYTYHAAMKKGVGVQPG